MNSLLLAASVVALQSFSPAVMAHAGGSCDFHGNKPAPQAVVANCANLRRHALVNSGKLESSWQSAKLQTLALVQGKKSPEWKVVFFNPLASDQTQQNLYIFFSHPGNFIAANFTSE